MRSGSLSAGMCLRALALLTLGFWAVSGVRAQERSSVPVVDLYQGELLELGVDTSLVNPSYNWILTKDREFVAAQRERFFQTRQSAAGEYTLDVSIQDATKTRTEHVSFLLRVREGRGPTSSLSTTTEGQTTIIPSIATFPPASADGSVSLDPAGGVITVDASGSQGPVSSYAIDVQPTVDTNGDGDPQNDADNAGTLSERNGTPLRYFLRPFTAPRLITVTLDSNEARAERIQIPVVFQGQTVPSGGIGGESGEITVEQDGLTAVFSVEINGDFDPSLLLYEWDFGDRGRSLLARASHTYREAGNYAVEVTVRNIATGDIVATARTTVSVTGVLPEPTEPDPGGEEPANGGSGGGVLKVLFTLIGIIAFAVVLFLLLRMLKNRTTGSLQQKIETIEGKLFDGEKEKQGVSEETATPHLQLRSEVPKAPKQTNDQEKGRAEVVRREENRNDASPTPRPNPTPAPTEGPAPAWLQNAQRKAESPAPQKPPAPAARPSPAPDRPAPPPPARPTRPRTQAAQAPVTPPARAHEAHPTPPTPPAPPSPVRNAENGNKSATPPSAPPRTSAPRTGTENASPSAPQGNGTKPANERTSQVPGKQVTASSEQPRESGAKNTGTMDATKKPEEAARQTDQKKNPPPSTNDERKEDDEPIATIRVESLTEEGETKDNV